MRYCLLLSLVLPISIAPTPAESIQHNGDDTEMGIGFENRNSSETSRPATSADDLAPTEIAKLYELWAIARQASCSDTNPLPLLSVLTLPVLLHNRRRAGLTKSRRNVLTTDPAGPPAPPAAAFQTTAGEKQQDELFHPAPSPEPGARLIDLVINTLPTGSAPVANSPVQA